MSSLKVHFIQQEPSVRPGEYLAWAERHGYETSFTKCWEEGDFPEPADVPDVLIVFGGPQNPGTTREECPHFDAAAECADILRCIDAGKVVVGSCLGAQLMGRVFSGWYSVSPEREVGSFPVHLTEEGRKDPFLRTFPDPFLTAECHNDMMNLGPDSVVLATSEGCPRQIVRYGKLAYGLQCHIEFNRGIVADLAEEMEDLLREGGRFVWTKEELLAYDYTDMNKLLSDFLDAIVAEYGQSRGKE